MSIGICEKVREKPHQPSGFLFNNDHFLREFVGFTSPEPGITSQLMDRKTLRKEDDFSNDSDISLLGAYDPPDEQILGANPTKNGNV